MCPISHYRLRFLTREASNATRAVAILISPDGKIAANATFNQLNVKEKSWLQVSFDHWCVNREWIPKRYHGWTGSEFDGKYKRCFVFKGNAKQRKLRLYGFLCHPKESNPRFELCILVHPSYKEGDETYEPDLEKTKEISLMPEVKQIYMNLFRG
ncbi:MAG: hypothetical protein IMZ64_11685 [Bacteroidetes bacterium]|nr:hypothetical protein [Bacteroidota bacterium]